MDKKSNAAPKRKEIFVRIDRCVACKTCEIQCALKRSSLSQRLPEAIYEAVSPMPRLQVQPIGDHGSLPIQCRHCEDAPCLDACPSGALQREKDGLVIMQEGKCIGCWMCLMVCPFGAIKPFREFRKAIKCDSCLGMGREPYLVDLAGQLGIEVFRTGIEPGRMPVLATSIARKTWQAFQMRLKSGEDSRRLLLQLPEEFRARPEF